MAFSQCVSRLRAALVKVEAEALFLKRFAQTSSEPPKIKLLPEKLHKQLFPDIQKVKRNKHVRYLTDEEFGIDFDLPPLMGRNLDEHFRYIAEFQSGSYKGLLDDLSNFTEPPTLPSSFEYREGWSKYTSDGLAVAVPFPEEDALVFDVEVCVLEGNAPTLAVALGRNGWYSWCSRRLVEENEAPSKDKCDLRPVHLVPMENGDFLDLRPRIIVGHHIGYDRARIREQYRLNKSGLRFWDTMSMHIATCGLTTEQQTMHAKHKKTNGTTKKDGWLSKLLDKTSMNNLKDVHALHCTESAVEVDKSSRKSFTQGNIEEIRRDFQDLMRYCAHDVLATLEVHRALWFRFQQKFPHPVTLSGMLEMSTTYLPINKNWRKYTEKAEHTHSSIENDMKQLLMDRATKALALQTDDSYKNDPWMWSENWSLLKLRKTSDSKRATLPKWYRDLCPTGSDQPTEISAGKMVVPKLLKLTWLGFPLFHTKEYGWVCLVPNKDQKELDCQKNDVWDWETRDNGETWYNNKENLTFPHAAITEHCKNKTDVGKLASNLKVQLHIIPGCHMFRLPHADGERNNVGNPFSKYMIAYLESGELASADKSLGQMIAKNSKMMSYWTQNRDRILNQVAVWNDSNTGAILPQVIAAGTVTRRAVESTWLTASNPKKDRIGSELKAMIVAPDGFCFVGADVDSQEQWIAALFGDQYESWKSPSIGATGFSRALLCGSRELGTDMHSQVAAELAITRDQAKILNYGRLYGAGLPYATILLKKWLPHKGMTEIQNKAEKLYEFTKGVKSRSRAQCVSEEDQDLLEEWKCARQGAVNYVQTPKGLFLNKETIKDLQVWLTESKNYTKEEIRNLRPAVWSGGTESAVFNALEKVIHGNSPKTPVLGCEISDSLKVTGNQFLPSRVNWVVQSSAVDFLHLLLTCMKWLCDEWDMEARFSISIHDEIHYLVSEKDKYSCSLALQFSNLLARAMFSYRVGLYQLPSSVAFFSQVDIDKVLRKECDDECVTPSNPQGLSVEYGIQSGEALSMTDICKLTKTEGFKNAG